MNNWLPWGFVTVGALAVSVTVMASIRLAQAHSTKCDAFPTTGATHVYEKGIIDHSGKALLQMANKTGNEIVIVLTSAQNSQQRFLATAIRAGENTNLKVPAMSFGVTVLAGERWCNLEEGFIRGKVNRISGEVTVRHDKVQLLTVSSFDQNGQYRVRATVSYKDPMQITGQEPITIQAAQDGHYYIEGRLNSTSVTFMVDTGATYTSVPEHIAGRAGIRGCQQIEVITASGKENACLAKIKDLRVGGVSLSNVEVVVIPKTMDNKILLGMNVLDLFDMRQAQRVLTLNPGHH